MNERLLAIRKELKLNQTDFGKKLGLSTASVSALESGQRNVTERHMLLLASEFNVNEEWLRHGEGEMFLKPKKFSLDQAAIESGLSELEIAIMQAYMDLSQDTRKEIVTKLKNVLNERNQTSNSYYREAQDVTTNEIDAELASYRLELEQEKKFQTSQVLHEQNAKYKDG
ncbi:transcriptional repressor DicA [Metalysinibacillus saudimassiliensis]|uniref:Transcriptional repressor DicA n=1 Tax=Metalysinibacillus saudimassiliensis TaxID=1461583 RepID=A0A078MHF5_9BACL|nr:transcriptional repressor DicA [Metalysinibacillus saudimassiliensis]